MQACWSENKGEIQAGLTCLYKNQMLAKCAGRAWFKKEEKLSKNTDAPDKQQMYCILSLQALCFVLGANRAWFLFSRGSLYICRPLRAF